MLDNQAFCVAEQRVCLQGRAPIISVKVREEKGMHMSISSTGIRKRDRVRKRATFLLACFMALLLSTTTVWQLIR